jgi:phosphate transport system ATP-binding protein
MTIYDNVAAGLRLNGKVPRAELDQVVEQSLKQAALWEEVKDRLKTSAMALSGGQQQRLCIARTIAPRPDVILLDEPTASLDPAGTQRIEELVFELKKDFTIVIVTHNMQQAARVSDTTSFFYVGTMVETGPTRQIFTAPQNEQTEAYIYRQVRMTHTQTTGFTMGSSLIPRRPLTARAPAADRGPVATIIESGTSSSGTAGPRRR